MMKRNCISVFVFYVAFLSPIILYSQPKPREAIFPKKKFDLAISAFGGGIWHFNEEYKVLFDESAFTSYGGSIFFQSSKLFGIQFDVKHSQANNSHQSTLDRSDGLYNYTDRIAEFECTSYILSLILFPAEVIKEVGLKPYFRVGWSKNVVTAYADWTRELKDENGEIVETEYDKFIDSSTYRKKYRNGLVLASGLYLIPDAYINLFIEMQYHSITSSAYNGGVFFNGGVIFTIF